VSGGPAGGGKLGNSDFSIIFGAFSLLICMVVCPFGQIRACAPHAWITSSVPLGIVGVTGLVPAVEVNSVIGDTGFVQHRRGWISLTVYGW
jgi:hypothetical protein